MPDCISKGAHSGNRINVNAANGCSSSEVKTSMDRTTEEKRARIAIPSAKACNAAGAAAASKPPDQVQG